MSELVDSLKKTYLCAGLTDEEVQQIAELAQVNTHLAGEMIIRQGEKSGDLVLILDGKANVITQGGEKIAEAGPGNMLGEVALIDDMPRSADVVCIGQTKIARFPALAFRSLLNSNRSMGFVVLANIGRVLTTRLRVATDRIDHLMGQDVWKGAL
ncbi:MAG: cyclic nucleotide-binding domain-containing protein [Armatimonadetes bacterium]|nr:cyclic nucleotide-binding domain-containing protein [Armatimonadota bacterium]